MKWEPAIIEGIEARRSKDNAQWKMGDLALQIETSYGDQTLSNYAEAIGVTFNTLQEYRRVAKAYEMSTRVDNLSWEHHRVMASRPERIEWLREANASGLSVRKLRARVEAQEATDVLDEALMRLDEHRQQLVVD